MAHSGADGSEKQGSSGTATADGASGPPWPPEVWDWEEDDGEGEGAEEEDGDSVDCAVARPAIAVAVAIIIATAASSRRDARRAGLRADSVENIVENVLVQRRERPEGIFYSKNKTFRSLFFDWLGLKKKELAASRERLMQYSKRKMSQGVAFFFFFFSRRVGRGRGPLFFLP